MAPAEAAMDPACPCPGTGARRWKRRGGGGSGGGTRGARGEASAGGEWGEVGRQEGE
jgi:hypothetical protein